MFKIFSKIHLEVEGIKSVKLSSVVYKLINEIKMSFSDIDRTKPNRRDQ
ncbi:protein of unknown function [Candidatus Nitrosocosmicus franklandus]|uniref:Uncharacterized protein n=1 Tax=Candidatus Nitrosocosmicus franklandianus TaxID=1798806 RepID=A0A484I8E7_9ARCH|nr:protein of unknown function [Candidatus Nitrosocosmicus franklandus]